MLWIESTKLFDEPRKSDFMWRAEIWNLETGSVDFHDLSAGWPWLVALVSMLGRWDGWATRGIRCEAQGFETFREDA